MRKTLSNLLNYFLQPKGPPDQQHPHSRKLPLGAKKLALLYYPKIDLLAQRICRIALFLCLVNGSFFAVLSLIFQWTYTPENIVVMTFLAYASIWFATNGGLGAGAEIALFFDPKRRDEYWAWWFALIGLAYGIFFFLCGIAWLWLLWRITPG